MTTTRRQFLKKAAAAGGTLLLGGSYAYLDNERMEPAPRKEGKILCDLHAHLASKGTKEDVTQILASPGLMGVGFIQGTKANLAYEQAESLVEDNKMFEEITPGQLARIGEGYFMRAQEIGSYVHRGKGKRAALYHILALGWEGEDYFSEGESRKIIEEIHQRKGLAFICHPYVTQGGLMFKIREEEEEKILEELCEMADGIEVYNGQNINLLPVIGAMKKTNELAEELAWKKNLLGIAVSDAHRRAEQVKTSGIYVQEEAIKEKGMEGLKEALKKREFELYKGKVSRYSWLRGMIL